MWRKFLNNSRGFTLPEVLVTLVVLVVVLVIGAQLLFSARAAAERQRYQVDARQRAREAVEYIHFMLRGATDMNGQISNAPSPLAILTYARYGNSGDVQVSYDNLTAAQAAAGFGDEGTDIITFARAEDARFVPISCWLGQSASSATLYFQFGDRCPDSAANLQAFKDLTGAHPVGSLEMSEPFIVYDESGLATFVQITNYKEGANANNCSNPPPSGGCGGGSPPSIEVIANHGLAQFVNPPGGFRDVSLPAWGALGVRFYSLRVWQGWLQQKRGVFNPSNPHEGFVNIVPNIEDVQIAYFFRNGQLWNNVVGSSAIPPATPLPWDAGFDPLAATAPNVWALRVTVTGRSSEEMPRVQENVARFFRPAAENRPAATNRDRFYHFQTSAMVLLRAKEPQV